MSFRITSSAFAEGAAIPVRHTCDDKNLSPQLTWTDAPPGTRSLLLIVDDPDAPRGAFTHWIRYDIPAGTHEFAEGVPAGAAGSDGQNSFGRTGYGGPCPPPGDPAHHYRFALFALDVASLGLSDVVTRDAVERRLDDHVLAKTVLEGTYQRRKAKPAGSRR